MMTLFIYGTLKRGQSANHLLAGQQFLGAAITAPVYRLFDLGGYPGMVRVARGGCAIEGEIWEIDKACLRALDRLEDVADGEYERTIIAMAEHENIEGYLYLRDVTTRPDAGSAWEAAAARKSRSRV